MFQVSDVLNILYPVLIFLTIAVVVAVILLGLRFIYSKYWQLASGYVLLELTPPAFIDRSAQATEALFTAIHGLGMTHSLSEMLLGKIPVFSVEIVSTRKDGIRFLVRAPEERAGTLEQIISSYIPEVKVKRVSDYLKPELKGRILEFKQSRHFAYPLKNFDELSSHDPVGYILSSMTKLPDNELIAYQVVFTPKNVREATELSRRILRNDALPSRQKKRPIVGTVIRLLNSAMFSFADAFSMSYHGPNNYDYAKRQRDLSYQKQVYDETRPARTLSYFEHELMESIHQKLSRPLFQANIRAFILADRKATSTHRKSIDSALSLFTVPKYQSLKIKHRKYSFAAKLLDYMYRKRIPNVTMSPMYLGANELSDLYHFPNSLSAKTENVVKSLSKTLPAPVSLKNGTELDVLYGENIHHGQHTPIGLTANERERHMYVIGGTGNGKTTMLLYSIVQDIQAGKGVAVLDPHGDLATTILRYIPKERIKDVVYINPDDLSRPIGINLLELSPGISGDELLREKDLVTESTISVLRKIFSDDDTGGHRIEYVLRNTIQTALTLEGSTLFTIFNLLNNTKYRKDVVRNLEDEDLKNFWKNEMGKAGDFQRVKMAAGITAKIGRFLFSASAKRILEQEKSTIDFSEILESKKIVICNFSKGLLGEDTSALFGTTILAKFQVAALRRARDKQEERQPYYLYVDEFQNFATMSFVQMLSEARKYKLFLTMAEQSTQQQQEQRMVDIILANVGTIVAFRSGSPADERLILPLFSPYINEGEIANLPAYNFYTRISSVDAQEPMSGMTVLLDSKGSDKTAQVVVEASRNAYGYERPQEPKKKPSEPKPAQKKSTPKKTKQQTLEEVA